MNALAGRYVLGSPLGSGGSATVFAAHDMVLDRAVAVKVLHPHLARDPVAVGEFLAQARATARLDHPNLVAVTDAGRGEDGLVWCVQELVDGLTLAELVAVGGPLTAADALLVIAGVLAGLAHAHVRGVLHLDLSAGNVMVRWGEGGPDLAHPAVLDLGGPHRPASTGRGTVRVSPAYASPEVATGSQPGPAADVYSVGVLLHVLLVGRPPFERATPAAVLEAHVHDVVPVPDGLDAPVAQLLRRCLAKDPADRFASATAAGVAVAQVRGALVARAPGRTLDLPVVGAASAGRRRAARTSPGAVVLLASLLGLGAVALAWADPGSAAPDVSAGPATTPRVGVPASPEASSPAVVPAADEASPTVAVPPLVGLDEAAARDAVTRAGLSPARVVHQDAPAPAGVVLESVPAEGTPVGPGTGVDLVVASGSTTVPDLRGLTGERARAAGVAAGVVVEGGMADDEVVGAQDLAPGDRVAVGALVRVAAAAREPVVPTTSPGTGPAPGPTSSPGPAEPPEANPTPVPTTTPAEHAPIG